MTRKQILDAAERRVLEDRDLKYGQPENNFKKIADLWTAYKGGATFTEKDVAVMMILLKIARGDDLDNFIDIAGYAACAGEIESEEGPNDE